MIPGADMPYGMLTRVTQTKEQESSSVRAVPEKREQTPKGFPVPPERFVALTAHEMQVPITTLSWNLERLERVLGQGPTSGDATRVLKRLREATERLITLVEDLLNLAKLQEGAFVVALRPVQLTEVVRKAMRTMERESLQRGLHIRLSADPRNIPLTVGDPDRLMQVVTNLLSNAIKYTPRGGMITVTLRRTLERGPGTVVPKEHPPGGAPGYVLCSIEDTGIGIPEDEKARVFQQFFRGRKAVASDVGGTGLGLFLVRTIVEQHEGAIWFTSREGYGTTFSFTVPIVNPYDNKTSPRPSR
jgi:signal transduction histidine kinase